jgi:hypothetical protein
MYGLKPVPFKARARVDLSGGLMYGLKPVPFELKPCPFKAAWSLICQRKTAMYLQERRERATMDVARSFVPFGNGGRRDGIEKAHFDIKQATTMRSVCGRGAKRSSIGLRVVEIST